MLSEAFVKVLCCCTWAYKMRDECVVGRESFDCVTMDGMVVVHARGRA